MEGLAVGNKYVILVAIGVAVFAGIAWLMFPRDNFSKNYLQGIGVQKYKVLASNDCGSFVDSCLDLVFETAELPNLSGLDKIDELDTEYLVKKANAVVGGDIDFSHYRIYRGDYFSHKGICINGCGVVFMGKSVHDPYFLSIYRS